MPIIRFGFRKFLSVMLLLWLPVIVNAQSVTVTGTVTNSKSDAIPGVSVGVKGGSGGTITDQAGHYSVNASVANGNLIFSSIGYTTQEIPINGRKKINIILKPESSTLDEVVVVAYGSVKKKTLRVR